MAGRRVGHVFVALAIAGCGSSEALPAAGGASGNGGAMQDGVAGFVAVGGAASGGSKNGGAENGGTHSGGAASGGSGNGGTHNAGGSAAGGGNAGASGSGQPPACVLKDDASAPFVQFERTGDPAPVATGGPIANGTYFLTKLTYHGGMHVDGSTCFPLMVREVLRFTATSETEGTRHSTLHFMYEDGSGDSTTATEATYDAQASTLTGEYTCSVTGDYRIPYTATSNQFLTITGTFDPPCDKGVVLVSVYEKQP